MGFKKNIDNARLVTPERAESIMNVLKLKKGLDQIDFQLIRLVNFTYII